MTEWRRWLGEGSGVVRKVNGGRVEKEVGSKGYVERGRGGVEEKVEEKVNEG